MTKGRGSNEARSNRRLSDRHGGGSQSGRLAKDSLKIMSDRVRPKYFPTNIEGVIKETDSFRDRLRKRFRRKKK